MNAQSVLKRLLWKELRISGPPVLVLAVLPSLMFRLGYCFPPHGSAEKLCMLMGVVIMGAVLVLWSASKATNGQQESEFSQTHLPVHPFLEWLVTLGVPGIAAGLAYVVNEYAFLFYKDVLGTLLWLPYSHLWFLLGTAVFVLVFYLASALGQWSGVLAGIVSSFCGIATLTTYSGVERLSQNQQADDILNMTHLLIKSGITLLIASLIFSVLTRRKPIRVRQAWSLGAVACGLVIVVWPFVHDLSLSSPNQYSARVVSANGQQVASASDYDSVDPDMLGPQVSQSEDRVFLTFTDYSRTRPVSSSPARHGRFVEALYKVHSPLRRAQPLCVSKGSVVYAEQAHSGWSIAIKVWRPESHEPDRFVTRFRTHLGVDIMDGGVRAWLSPSGRYLMVMTESNWSLNYKDIRVVDLKEGSARLAAYKQTIYQPAVTWKGDTALIGRVSWPFAIEMATAKASPINQSGRIEN